MIDLLMRRREMGAHEKEPFVIPYITDGLILYLDGIEQGNTSGAWTDLIDGLVFIKKGSGVTFGSNYVQFDSGDNKSLYNTDRSEFVNSTVGTIEVCYRDVPTTGSTARTAFFSCGVGSSGWNGLGISLQFQPSASKVICSTGNTSSRPYNGVWTPESTGTYSYTSVRTYQNGISKGFTTDKNYLSRAQAAAVVGGAGSNATNHQNCLNGKLHSIRIYNRQLTEEEVLANQAVDNTRFNLGLTINT